MRAKPNHFSRVFATATCIWLLESTQWRETLPQISHLAVEHSHRSALWHLSMQRNKPCDIPSLKRDLRIPQTGTWSIWWRRIAACRDGKRQKAKALWIARGRNAVRWWTTQKFKLGLQGDAAEFNSTYSFCFSFPMQRLPAICNRPHPRDKIRCAGNDSGRYTPLNFAWNMFSIYQFILPAITWNRPHPPVKIWCLCRHWFWKV